VSESIERRQANRSRFLHRLYDFSGGQKFPFGKVDAIGADIGSTPRKPKPLLKSRGEGLLTRESLDGSISITVDGVDEVEWARRRGADSERAQPASRVRSA
jgi:hypothetical protein